MKGLIRNTISLLIVVVVFPLVSTSQDTFKIDSLSQLIDASPDDSSKVNLLLNLYWEYRRSDPEKALSYANQAFQLSTTLDYTFGIASSRHQIGIIEKIQGNYLEASEAFQGALSNFQKIHDTNGIIGCYTDLGDIFNRQNRYEEALGYLDTARNLATNHNNDEKLSRIYNMLGGIYNSQKQFEKALEYHGKSLALNKALGFILGMSVNYNNIGNVYLKLKDYDKATENYGKALDLKFEIRDAIGIASTYNNLGLISLEKKDYTKAMDYHSRTLKQYLEIDDKSGIAMCYINLANDHLESELPQRAIEFAKKGIAITEAINLKETQTEAYRILSEAYAKTNRFDKAFYFQKLYKLYNDSIQNLEVVRQITEMESKFEVANKEKEIALLNLESEKKELRIKQQRSQRNLMIGFTALVLVILAFLYWNFRNKQKLNQQLKELNLTKSRFFAHISHEFRTPLTLLLGPLEKLLKNPRQEDKEMIKIMHRNASRLLMLDNQLLDLSKLEAGKLRLEVGQGNIDTVLKGMVMSFQSLAEKQNIDFQTRFPEEPIEAWFDQDKLEKIVYNLLANAIKFTPEKGRVIFELSTIADRKNVPPLLKTIKGRLICIGVSDTGQGIAKEHLPFIFDRFYQIDSRLNRNFEGTGLGLSLSKELVELHHGKLIVESEPSKGSTFRVYLPIDEEAYELNEISDFNLSGSDLPTQVSNADKQEFLDKIEIDKEPLNESLNEDHLKVLLVEDNPDMRLYIRDCFGDQYDIAEAADGEAGLDKAIDIIPDIIISDLMMPKMDGIELTNKLKNDERTSHIPVILLTALASVEDRIRGLAIGADDYIAKPFNRQELQTRVQNLIDQRKKLIERFSKSVRLEANNIAITSVDEKFIEKLILKIEGNLSNPDLNVDNLIEEIHLSRSQLHRKLKALTGMSATEFIRSIRLKRAAQLLEQHYGTIAETVYAVGFNNLSYFSKCFLKQFNMTPKEYIEQS
ncbi:MAG: tetratricopeptide repeat protein [Bacteroidetes bacterium]|nr:tetratricopeptide repeat protein [Bacteroidota bacterium]